MTRTFSVSIKWLRYLDLAVLFAFLRARFIGTPSLRRAIHNKVRTFFFLIVMKRATSQF